MSDAPPLLEAVKNAVNALALPDVQRQTGSVPNIVQEVSGMFDSLNNRRNLNLSGAGHEASPRS